MGSAHNGPQLEKGTTRVSPGTPTLSSDLVDNIISDAKLFADDTSLFTVEYDENIATE